LYELAELEIAFNNDNDFLIFKDIAENPLPEIKDKYLNQILKM
jgi:hypothetical protein